MSDDNRVEAARELWDSAAADFDNEPDHGLRDPDVRMVWKFLLSYGLPAAPGKVLDIGCGTGSLSLLLAELGYSVTGIDVSPAMLAQAQAKAQAAGYTIPFQVMDAAFPTLEAGQFDAIVCRHLLWALPDTAGVLQRWTTLLKPGGSLLLIEGFWHTGAGLHAAQITAAMPETFTRVDVQNLSNTMSLWGGWVDDERYMVIARP